MKGRVGRIGSAIATYVLLFLPIKEKLYPHVLDGNDGKLDFVDPGIYFKYFCDKE